MGQAFVAYFCGLGDVDYLDSTQARAILSPARCLVSAQCAVLQDAVFPKGAFLVGVAAECALVQFYVAAYLFSVTVMASLSHCLLSLSSNAERTLSVAFSHLW